MSTRRSSVGVTVLNGCVYAVGGYDGQSRNCLASAERYEPRMNRWLPIADMATRRSVFLCEFSSLHRTFRRLRRCRCRRLSVRDRWSRRSCREEVR